MEDIEKICDAFEISLSEFFKEKDIEETNFRKRRKQLGVSVEKLSEVTGLDIKLIEAYDLGKKDITKAQFRIVKKLATALSCTTDKIT